MRRRYDDTSANGEMDGETWRVEMARWLAERGGMESLVIQRNDYASRHILTE